MYEHILYYIAPQRRIYIRSSPMLVLSEHREFVVRPGSSFVSRGYIMEAFTRLTVKVMYIFLFPSLTTFEFGVYGVYVVIVAEVCICMNIYVA